MTQHCVLGNKICQITRIPAVSNHPQQFFIHPGRQLIIVMDIYIGLPQQGLQFFRVRMDRGLRDQLHIHLEIGFRLPQALHLGAALTFYQDADGAFRDTEYLSNGSYRPHGVKIFLFGEIDPHLFLRHQKEIQVVLHGALQRPDGDFPLHIYCGSQLGKNRHAPQCQGRNIHGCHILLLHGLFGSPFRPSMNFPSRIDQKEVPFRHLLSRML